MIDDYAVGYASRREPRREGGIFQRLKNALDHVDLLARGEPAFCVRP
jgi:hypothetical protein